MKNIKQVFSHVILDNLVSSLFCMFIIKKKEKKFKFL